MIKIKQNNNRNNIIYNIIYKQDDKIIFNNNVNFLYYMKNFGDYIYELIENKEYFINNNLDYDKIKKENEKLKDKYNKLEELLKEKENKINKLLIENKRIKNLNKILNEENENLQNELNKNKNNSNIKTQNTIKFLELKK